MRPTNNTESEFRVYGGSGAGREAGRGLRAAGGAPRVGTFPALRLPVMPPG